MATTDDGSRSCMRRMMAALAVSASLAVTMAACATNNDPGVAVAPVTTTVAPPTTTAAVAPTTTVAPKATVATATNAAFGTILVDATGKTLYTFDKDTGGSSQCSGGCAGTWPALVLPAGVTTPAAGTGVTNLTTVVRPDDPAKMQVAWNGKPLYNYSADSAPGDTRGDGIGGIWHVAKAD